MPEKGRVRVLLNGRAVEGEARDLLSELAFEHYPVRVEAGEGEALLRERVRTALSDYEDLYTVEGVRRSVRRLTGRDPILIEHFQVSPNRPDCKDPELYRRL